MKKSFDFRVEVDGQWVDYRDVTKEDIKWVVDDDPLFAFKCLGNHPLFDETHLSRIISTEDVDLRCLRAVPHHPLFSRAHFDLLVRSAPTYVAIHLKSHLWLSQPHIDYIVEHRPATAREHLADKFSEENHKQYKPLFTNLSFV
jgi:hypothetical protein